MVPGLLRVGFRFSALGAATSQGLGLKGLKGLRVFGLESSGLVGVGLRASSSGFAA